MTIHPQRNVFNKIIFILFLFRRIFEWVLADNISFDFDSRLTNIKFFRTEWNSRDDNSLKMHKGRRKYQYNETILKNTKNWSVTKKYKMNDRRTQRPMRRERWLTSAISLYFYRRIMECLGITIHFNSKFYKRAMPDIVEEKAYGKHD